MTGKSANLSIQPLKTTGPEPELPLADLRSTDLPVRVSPDGLHYGRASDQHNLQAHCQFA
jgi:hypothetical protein